MGFHFFKVCVMNNDKKSLKMVLLAAALGLLLSACGSNPKVEAPAEALVSDVKPKPVDQVVPKVEEKPAQVVADVVSEKAAESRKIEPVNAQPPVVVITPPDVAKIIYFDYDSFVVRPEFQSALEAHAKYLSADASRKVVLEGHTDDRGGREYNLSLGQKRAEAVQRVLVLFGLDAQRVEAVSFGKERPAASGEDEASRSKNRRAEIVYR
jgi:peptidoglycan-associated lipoprotein